MKRSVLLALIVTVVLVSGCSEQVKMTASGYTQGTTYSVIYYDIGRDLQYQIDSVLLTFDRELSTYQETSYISKWNRNEHIPLEQPQRFKEVIKRAAEIHAITKGAFDITVPPLMEYWFERDWGTAQIDSSEVDSIMNFVGMRYVVLEGEDYVKTNEAVQLDVNAIAQGYSVDVISRYLESLGIFNYLVEIGGEVRASGLKPDQEKEWLVGIDKSSDENLERELTMSVKLKDRAMATSGNYRKFVEIDGQKFGHSLNPLTGFPAKTDILSASVFAKDCMTADAYATAFMAMGFEDARRLVESDESLDAVLIHSTEGVVKTWQSDGISESIIESDSE